MSGYARPGQAVVRPLLEAFTQQRIIIIQYRDADDASSRRTIEAQYLCYSLPAWYVMAWDRVRDDVRAFRIDRITSAALLDEPFRLRNLALSSPPDRLMPTRCDRIFNPRTALPKLADMPSPAVAAVPERDGSAPCPLGATTNRSRKTPQQPPAPRRAARRNRCSPRS
jgi:predicted DNA-binding transcriptional regulator YafY